jgi:hypothetical protein
MQMHKTKCLVNLVWILDLMKFKLLNAHLTSIEPHLNHGNSYLDLTFFKTLWNIMIDLMMIFHILVEGLMVLRNPKASLTLFVMVILNMDLYTSRVEAHNTLVTTCFETPIFILLQNIPFTTFKWVLNDSSQSSNN